MSDEDDVEVTRFVELSAKQLGTVTAGGTRGGASEHMISNCMRTMSDTQNSIASNLKA